tara:strand:- start:1465 stop:2499 length:1035 start_codon:yes stop_codon:yes gene_type:complete
MVQKGHIHKNILDLIGGTPMIRLNNSVKSFQGEFFAKYEGFNPGHSSKDRIALFIIEDAERKGLINNESTIIETTSGNTGFSLAMVALVKGYNCILAVSDKSSKDKIEMLAAMGAKVYVCPSNVGPDDPKSYVNFAKKIHNETDNSIYINQYFNELNVDAHYSTTGPEIWKQMNGDMTHFIACSGTGGTISGVAKYLKEKNPNIKVIGVDAYGSVLKKFHETGVIDQNEIFPYKVEGLGKNFIPSSTKFELIDSFVKVSDKESAHSALELTKSEGIFLGYTSGSILQALKQLSGDNEFKKDSRVVVIFPDHGSRYLSKIYSDEWMFENGFYDKTNTDIKKIKYI